ncbi:1020_t:CDS:1 [Cetraspora pellucida]|uniref:1020_t:CDS:1 n=1 Tax=Cetraspora pellucida TaxID=1433469 RepID=A0A9N8VHN8_9GLOM|nr:1020_t:CDS:1 [Cetraspora pellucida]
MTIEPELNSLIKSVYCNIFIKNICTDQYLKDRIILSSHNTDVNDINITILNSFPRNQKIYLSLDKIVFENNNNFNNLYPSEFLNSLKPAGMPPSSLTLKIGCPIILLRNLAPYQDLCNSSRLIVTRLNDYVIEAHILTEDHAGNLTFIPRISLMTSTSELLFKLK